MWPIILSIVICILILVIGYYKRHYLKTLKGKWINQHTTSQPKPKRRARRNSSVNLNETLRTTVPLHVAGQVDQGMAEGQQAESGPPFVQRGKIPTPTVLA
jgi:hypothetical protein